MEHQVTSVQSLYDDSKSLYDQYVVGSSENSAAGIIKNLDDGIANLKDNWGGKDAGVQINNIIAVRNAMVSVYNALGVLVNEAMKVASNYREIQNSNGAGLEQLVVITPDTMSTIGDYSDDRDTINIKPEVSAGLSKITSARNSMEPFITNSNTKFEEIMGNWTKGDPRETVAGNVQGFFNKANEYKELLSQATTSLEIAIKNYGL